LTTQQDQYIINLQLSNTEYERLERFYDTGLYQWNKRKINLCVGCIWLSMAPLNVDQELNKFLFLLAMEKLNELL
jgi:hypothetical protein